MNKERQRWRINSFLQGKGSKDIDSFCVYQWIERCHFEEWWDLALSLSRNVPPNSLNDEYHKRLNYLVSFCRDKRSPKRKYIRTIITDPSGRQHVLPELKFENASKETLHQIYAVIFYLTNSNDSKFQNAVRWSMKVLNINHYSTVCAKCTTRFAGTVNNFENWYESGEILQKLDMKFCLSTNDFMLFKDLLEGKKKDRIGHKTYTNE
jgi:hypothetical protein